jgi:hypothetical protein
MAERGFAPPRVVDRETVMTNREPTARRLVGRATDGRVANRFERVRVVENLETKIVVKYDAALLLRQELCRPSWHGDTIALSGVTDCYQPCEAKGPMPRAFGPRFGLLPRSLASPNRCHPWMVVNFVGPPRRGDSCGCFE